MSKAFLKGEVEREFKILERQRNTQQKLNQKTKPLSERLPTNRHGRKKALKRLKNGEKKPKASKPLITPVQPKGEMHISTILVLVVGDGVAPSYFMSYLAHPYY